MVSGIGGKGMPSAAIKSEREVKEPRARRKHITKTKIKHAPRNEKRNHPFILCDSYGLLAIGSLSKDVVDDSENVI